MTAVQWPETPFLRKRIKGLVQGQPIDFDKRLCEISIRLTIARLIYSFRTLHPASYEVVRQCFQIFLIILYTTATNTVLFFSPNSRRNQAERQKSRYERYTFISVWTWDALFRKILLVVANRWTTDTLLYHRITTEPQDHFLSRLSEDISNRSQPVDFAD